MKTSVGLSEPKPVVLIVDDDISVRESLEFLMSTVGMEPRLFTSAKEFLEYPQRDAAACMILDVNMPGLSGLDLQGILNSNENRVPIIFISGFGDDLVSVRASEGGACDFLLKPIDTSALLEAVRSGIARSDAVRATGLGAKSPTSKPTKSSSGKPRSKATE